MENQNPTPNPVSSTPAPSLDPQVIPTSPNTTPDIEQQDIHLGGVGGKKASKYSIKAIIGIIIILLLVGSLTVSYVYRDQINKLISPKITTKEVVNKNLNPNTGSFYKDVAQRLKEEFK